MPSSIMTEPTKYKFSPTVKADVLDDLFCSAKFFLSYTRVYEIYAEFRTVSEFIYTGSAEAKKLTLRKIRTNANAEIFFISDSTAELSKFRDLWSRSEIFIQDICLRGIQSLFTYPSACCHIFDSKALSQTNIVQIFNFIL